MYRVLSLFSGAGGLDLGFTLLRKFQIIFANDISEPATKTYSLNFKVKYVSSKDDISCLPVIFRGDISDVDFDSLGMHDVDVIIGGPPCQDFSIIRGPAYERGGIEVTRGKLYSHFVRALISLQPQLFVFENVPGLISANKGKAYRVITDDFSNLEVRWPEIRRFLGNNSAVKPKNYVLLFNGLVDAMKLGVPQARKRLIIIGVRKDFVDTAWWKIQFFKDFAENVLSGRKSLVGKYPLTTLETFEGRPLSELHDEYERIMKEYEGVATEVGTPRAMMWLHEKWKKLRFDAVKDYIALNGIQPSNEDEICSAFEEHAKLLREIGYYNVKVRSIKPPDGSNEIPNDSPIVIERMRRIPPGENHEFVEDTKWAVKGRGISLIYRRLHPLKPAYTVVAYGGGGTWGYHYERSRATLTNRENARLQTFPDSFLFVGGRSQVRAQIGEAVPPLMAKRIGEVVLRILEES
jgi:DNA (cytosine-5)-methyltransferase 1